MTGLFNWKTLASGAVLGLANALKTNAPNTVWWHVGDVLTYIAPALLGYFAKDSNK